MLHGTSTLELAVIVICDSVGRADWVVFCFAVARRNAGIVGTFKLVDAVHKAKVLEVDVGVPGADRVPFVRTSACLVLEDFGVVVLDSADPIVGQVDFPVLPPAVVPVSDPIHSTNWQVLVGAVGDVLVWVFGRYLHHAPSVVRFDCRRLVQFAKVFVGLVVLSADGRIAVRAEAREGRKGARECENSQHYKTRT